MVKMAILSKAIYTFNVIPINFLAYLFIDLEKSNSQHHIKKKKKKKKKTPMIAKTVLNNKRTSGGTTIPDLKLY
jgi:hypothetical protein